MKQRSRWSGISWVLLALIGFGSRLDAQSNKPARGKQTDRWGSVIAQARAYVIDSMKACRVPGATIAVAVDGKLVWSEAFGVADVELNVPATTKTKFRIGSVSKALTAGALGLLMKEGKIDLDAGIRHYKNESEFLSQKRYKTVEEGLTIFADDTLLFEPGLRYSYSSYGFNLLSAAMERASGMDYLALMQKSVFGPLGMTHTVPEYPDSIIPNRSSFYLHDPASPLTNAPWVDNSYKWAGGGFLSTTEDLIRYANTYLGTMFVGSSVRDVMFTSQRTRSGEESKYSIGWQISIDSTDGRIVAHGGASVGGTALLLIFPDRGVTAAILCNNDSRFTACARRVASMFTRGVHHRGTETRR